MSEGVQCDEPRLGHVEAVRPLRLRSTIDQDLRARRNCRLGFPVRQSSLVELQEDALPKQLKRRVDGSMARVPIEVSADEVRLRRMPTEAPERANLPHSSNLT